MLREVLQRLQDQWDPAKHEQQQGAYGGCYNNIGFEDGDGEWGWFASDGGRM
jgi:hypothetical protein